MRILMLSVDYRPNLGGIATATHELAKALSSSPGVELLLLAPCGDGPLGNETQDGVAVERVSLSKSTLVSILQLTWLLSKKVKSAEGPKIDAVLSTLWLPCSVACWLSRFLIGKKAPPYFTIVHGVEILESNRTLRKRLRRLFRSIKKLAVAGSKILFPVSEFTARLVMRECGVGLDRQRILRNGVDAEQFQPDVKSAELVTRFGLRDRTIFFTLSRLEDYKGIDRAIEGLAQAVRVNPKLVYLIGGAGPDRGRLESLVAQYQLESSVRFLGRVEDGDLSRYYQLCDVFILLSRDDWETPNFEGLGIVLLEAAACGKPALVWAAGGMPEVVVNGKTGWVLPTDQPERVAEAMLEAARDSEQTQRFGAAARRRVQEEFRWEQAAQTMLGEMEHHVRN